jgi:hypothetical protein
MRRRVALYLRMGSFWDPSRLASSSGAAYLADAYAKSEMRRRVALADALADAYADAKGAVAVGAGAGRPGKRRARPLPSLEPPPRVFAVPLSEDDPELDVAYAASAEAAERAWAQPGQRARAALTEEEEDAQDVVCCALAERA